VVRIERRHAGYVLDVDPDLVDLHRFCRLIQHGGGPRCSDVAWLVISTCPAPAAGTKPRAAAALGTLSRINSMHRLVQAVTRDQLGAQSATREWVKAAHNLLGAAFPAEPLTVVSVTTQHHVARDLFAELLLVQQRVLGTDHPDTLSTYYNMSLFTGQSGDHAEARDLCVDLVAVQQRVLGAEHPDTLGTRSRLAYWTGQAGDIVGARDLATELLPVQQRVLGAEHPDTLNGHHNLARWTGYLGDLAGARDLYTELLTIREWVLGAEHPDTLTTRDNLAYWTMRAAASDG
jgi:hypothetical protein